MVEFDGRRSGGIETRFFSILFTGTHSLQVSTCCYFYLLIEYTKPTGNTDLTQVSTPAMKAPDSSTTKSTLLQTNAHPIHPYPQTQLIENNLKSAVLARDIIRPAATFDIRLLLSHLLEQPLRRRFIGSCHPVAHGAS